MEVGCRHHTPATLPLEMTRYPLCRMLGGPQIKSVQMQKISPPPQFRLCAVQPIVSYCTAWALLAHEILVVEELCCSPQVNNLQLCSENIAVSSRFLFYPHPPSVWSLRTDWWAEYLDLYRGHNRRLEKIIIIIIIIIIIAVVVVVVVVVIIIIIIFLLLSSVVIINFLMCTLLYTLLEWLIQGTQNRLFVY